MDLELFSARQHYWQAWLWRQPPELRLWSRSAFNQFVPTATTDTRLTSARRWGITVPVTSITASSWAWDPGAAGAIVTVGAGTALSTKVAVAITADLAA